MLKKRGARRKLKVNIRESADQVNEVNAHLHSK
jgi:hypothetical protein